MSVHMSRSLPSDMRSRARSVIVGSFGLGQVVASAPMRILLSRCFCRSLSWL